jgi:hypothetical protein
MKKADTLRVKKGESAIFFAKVFVPITKTSIFAHANIKT